jgi:hypothetical protein
MKLFYPKMRKRLFALSFFTFAISFGAKTQFTTAGDIAFTGYLGGTTNESFSFVLLKNIPSGSTLNFTDRGWNGTAFNAGTESLLTWAAGSALVAGREITISGAANSTTMTVVVSGSNISAGTATGTMVSMPTSGDQILAYIGTVASPTFIAGIHMNSYNNTAGGADCGNTTAAAWDNATVNACVNPGNANSSAMPTGLTGGTTAVYIGVDNQFNTDFDNARFNCTGPLATPAQVRASVNTYTAGVNWTTVNGDPTGVLTLPSGCAYLASIFPVDIISVTGSSQASYIGLNWKTANEAHDNGRYEIEKSADGISFSKIAGVNAQGFSYLYNNYVYNDYNAFKGANFYRLKIISPNGDVKYSSVIKVIFGELGRPVIITNNPANNDITVASKGAYTQLAITDLSGRTVLRERLLTNNQKIDVSHLAPGQYAITFTGASAAVTEKLVIQR